MADHRIRVERVADVDAGVVAASDGIPDERRTDPSKEATPYAVLSIATTSDTFRFSVPKPNDASPAKPTMRKPVMVTLRTRLV